MAQAIEGTAGVLVAEPVNVPILMYHRIGPVQSQSIVAGQYVSTRQFELQLVTLKTLGYEAVTLGQMYRGLRQGHGLPRKPVVLTFDDGYDSFHSRALPILRKHEMVATVFLVSAELGGKNSWDIAKGDVTEPLMSISQIRECLFEGIEMGSHTCTHANLVEIASENAQQEINDSRKNLEDTFAVPIEFLCYPYGAQNMAVREWTREAGYLGATSTEKGLNGPADDPFRWKRMNVRRTTWLPKFITRVLRGG